MVFMQVKNRTPNPAGLCWLENFNSMPYRNIHSRYVLTGVGVGLGQRPRVCCRWRRAIDALRCRSAAGTMTSRAPTASSSPTRAAAGMTTTSAPTRSAPTAAKSLHLVLAALRLASLLGLFRPGLGCVSTAAKQINGEELPLIPNYFTCVLNRQCDFCVNLFV